MLGQRLNLTLVVLIFLAFVLVLAVIEAKLLKFAEFGDVGFRFYSLIYIYVMW